MGFNRFDIVAAWYFFCANYHNGQFGSLYAKLQHIEQKLRFKPSPLWNGPSDVSENCQNIYDSIVRKYLENKVSNAGLN